MKQPKRWQGQAIKFGTETITTVLPSSEQLKTLELVELQALSNNLRNIQETLNEFQSIIASTWLSTRS